MRAGAKLWAVAMVAFAAVSCGGSDETCSGAAPCGGEISAGRYRLDSYCVSMNQTITSPTCPAGINVRSGAWTATGHYIFNADRTLAVDLTLSGEVIETIPAECLNVRGVQLTCEQVGASFQAQAGPGMSATCSGSGSCTCTLKLADLRSMGSGSYSVSGTTLSVTNDQGETSRTEYCATGGRLTLQAESSAGMGMPAMMEMLQAKGTIVLTRE